MSDGAGYKLRIRGALPKGRDNGLDNGSLAKDLHHAPHVIYALLLLEPVAVTEDLEHGPAFTITLGIDAVELLDPKVGGPLLRDAFAERTGIVELALDGPTDGPPAGVDPVTGELLDHVAEQVADLIESATDGAVTIDRPNKKGRK